MVMLRVVVEVGGFFAGDVVVGVCESVQLGEGDRSAAFSLFLFFDVLGVSFVARGPGEFVCVLDGAFGDAGEEGLFGGEFLFGLLPSPVLVETCRHLRPWRG